eukprot:TRINITY_DN5805_c0_g1_i1.p1 TRINITY_DN5805_c0_g1~~TRINITY_DN5805_c0_g1_i1.p1  ORF type:complete len:367 (+),score=36.78 TRINITY_DN5805_c0_g1_i1:31-1131(+)
MSCVPLAALCAFVAQAVPLWPPSAQGDPEALGGFDGSWKLLGGAFAAHADFGGRTVANRGCGDVLHVFLPGTFTVPQQFSAILKASVRRGLDTIGLDYGWGPAPDTPRSEQCNAAALTCQACQRNYHELIGFGGGEDLIAGPYPVFGDNQNYTLKYSHFLAFGVSFLPEYVPPMSDVHGPLPRGARDYINSIKVNYSVEPLLTKVLLDLGWSEYLSPSGRPDWSNIVISGHSQGASHAGYIAQNRNVRGALLFSGPQDTCGKDGAPWAARSTLPYKHSIFGCHAVEEPGKPYIERNEGFISEVTKIHAPPGGWRMSHGNGSWCNPPTHCATAVDDQLADESVEKCFSKLSVFAPHQNGCLNDEVLM